MEAPGSRLIAVLRQNRALADLLPELHKELLAVLDGTASVLLVLDTRSRQLHPVSGYGIASLPLEPWLTAPAAAKALRRAMKTSSPSVLTSAEFASARLDVLQADLALIVPVPVTDADPGVLIAGLREPPGPAALEALKPVVGAFSLALERARLEREIALQRELRDLLRDFAQASADTLDVAAGLSVVCERVARLFAADRASLWLHERRTRELVLQAASEPRGSSVETRVSVEDALSVAATALRRGGAELVIRPDADAGLSAPVGLAVPLKGRRRALGTLVVEGVRVEPGTVADVLARADEIGRQLAAAIENVQLLGDVIAARRQLEDVFDTLTDLVLVCDADARIVRANRAFADRCGTPREELADRALDDHVSSAFSAWIRRAAEAPGSATPSAVIDDDRLGGTFAVTATPFRQAGSAPALLAIVARDISRDREIESVQAELNSRLIQTEKLAALGQFVAGIAHELNNPLQGVLGHLELLRATGAITPPLRRELRWIYREAQRAARIVRDLLMFAGPHGIRRRRVPVKSLFNSVAVLRADALRRRNIQLAVELPSDVPAIAGNPFLLQQALLNVVVNAEQAIGSNGRILLRGAVEADTVRIEVIDSGPGIPADVLPRVFEPFFTAKPTGEGTGLGLAVVYGIVRDHRGSVTAGNAPNAGAVFTITLPVHRAGGKMDRTRDTA